MTEREINEGVLWGHFGEKQQECFRAQLRHQCRGQLLGHRWGEEASADGDICDAEDPWEITSMAETAL